MPVRFRITKSADGFAIFNDVRELGDVTVFDLGALRFRQAPHGDFFERTESSAESLKFVFVELLPTNSDYAIGEPGFINLVKILLRNRLEIDVGNFGNKVRGIGGYGADING